MQDFFSSIGIEVEIGWVAFALVPSKKTSDWTVCCLLLGISNMVYNCRQLVWVVDRGRRTMDRAVVTVVVVAVAFVIVVV